MRKSFWIIVLMCAAVGVSSAYADSTTSYKINFTATSGSPLPTSGAFVYDKTTDQFSSFTVVWNGLTFDLTSAANSPTIRNSGPPCISGDTGAQATLALMTTCSSSGIWEGFTPANVSRQSSFQFYDGSCVGVTCHDTFITDFESTGAQTANDAHGTYGYTVEVADTPEPGSLALLGSGLFGLMGVTRNRFRK